MTQFDIHPAANIFPPLGENEYQSLKADIKENGQWENIYVYDGKIVDGRNRYRACCELGIDPMWCELDDDVDPVAFSLSKNLHRRHLDDDQRGVIAALVEQHYKPAAKEQQKKSPGRPKKGGEKKPIPDSEEVFSDGPNDRLAIAQAAKQLNVSRHKATLGKTLLENGSEELIEAVKSGEVKLAAAAKVAKVSPKEIQMDEVKAPKPKRQAKPKPAKKSAVELFFDLWAKATDEEKRELREAFKKL